MEAALVLRNNVSSLRVSKDGCPTICVMVGCGNTSIILSTDDIVLTKGGCYPAFICSGGSRPSTLVLLTF